MQRTEGFSSNLDLLRAIAVLCVFAGHFAGAAFHDRSYSSLGRFGVILFFIHTSYVLMASLNRLSKSGPTDRSLAFAFWVRRIFRIYPLAMVAVLVVIAFRIPPNPGGVYEWIGWKNVLANLSLCQNLTFSPNLLGPLWSLPLEVQMYVLLPFAFMAIRGTRRANSILLWILALVLALVTPHVWAINRCTTFLFAPCFMAGVLAYDVLRHRHSTFKLPAWLWPLGIFVAIAIFKPHDNVSLPDKIWKAWFLSLALGLLYVFVKETSVRPLNWLSHWIAEHSYGIYLSHSVILWLCFDQMVAFPVWAKAATLIALWVAIPIILYRFIEKPLMKQGGIIAKRLLTTNSRELVRA